MRNSCITVRADPPYPYGALGHPFLGKALRADVEKGRLQVVSPAPLLEGPCQAAGEDQDGNREAHCAQAAGHDMCDQAMGRTQLSPTSSTHADATHLRMLVGFGSFDWQFLSDFWHEKAGPRPQKAQQERLETIRSDQQSLVEISNMPNGE